MTAKPPSAADDTRERILRVAAGLFADKGYHATGIAELERAVGLGRGALYHHIASKEDLLWDINSRYLIELIDGGEELVAMDLDPVERLHRLSRRVMSSIASHLPELTVCFRETRSVTGERRQSLLALHQRYEDVWAATLLAGYEAGRFQTADTLAVKALLGMHHYSYLWLRPDGPRLPEDIADFFTELILNGLANRQSGAGRFADSPSGHEVDGRALDDTRERILRVAAGLFADKGYHATGIAELERAVGLGRGALYHHIASKEDLLWDINSRYLIELIDGGEELVAMDLDPVERLHRLSRRVMSSIASHLPELTVCFRETRSVTGERRQSLLALHQRYEDVWAATLLAGYEAGRFQTADTLAVKALLGMHHYSYLWLRPDGPRLPEDIADFFTELILNGLANRQSEPSRRTRRRQ